MNKYVIKRILSLVPVLIIVSILIFFLIHLTPGDPARTMLGDQDSEQQVMQLRASLGLNDPIPIQYIHWVEGLFKGNFGYSIFIKEPMTQIIAEHITPTICLTLYSLVIALIISLPCGIIAARRKGKTSDYSIQVFNMFGISIPSFLLGMFLIIIFAVNLKILPSAGYKPIEDSGFLEFIRYLTLPAISLGLMQAALITRMTRASILEVLNMDYIRMAKAKGVKTKVIILKHALRNALLPIITVIGQSFIALLSGATVVEIVFNIPGVGQLIVNSVLRRDYEVIQAIILVIALINVVVNIIVDLLYGLVDPRIRLE
jgi:peptide/nickel transport system permease protein